jgi:hypothetical protein
VRILLNKKPFHFGRVDYRFGEVIGVRKTLFHPRRNGTKWNRCKFISYCKSIVNELALVRLPVNLFGQKGRTRVEKRRKKLCYGGAGFVSFLEKAEQNIKNYKLLIINYLSIK